MIINKKNNYVFLQDLRKLEHACSFASPYTKLIKKEGPKTDPKKRFEEVIALIQ
jgi:hypothetical protein